MNWPFVSRLAYDTLRDERDWLRGELQKALDHTERLERVASGLSELAPQRRKQLDPMPQELADLIGTLGNEAMQADATKRATNVARQYGWPEAKRRLEAALAEDAE